MIVIVVMASGPANAQIDWLDFGGNPVMDSNFDALSTAIWRPSVVIDGDTAHMWYGKEDGDGVEVMGYATSADGIAWTLQDPRVLDVSPDPNRFDSEDASQGWVIDDAGTFKMWYWGNGPNGGNIGYATSSDGANWTRVDGPATDGSVYDMAMDGSSPFAIATPSVVKDGGTYHMWYSRLIGFDVFFIGRIAYATSPDGIAWTNVPGSGTDGAVLDWGPSGAFDAFTVLWPAVIKTDAGFFMWYQGAEDNTGTNGGLGCASSTDGVNWTRIPGNEPNGSCFDGAHLASVIHEDDLFTMWYGIFGSGNSDEVHVATSEDVVSSIELVDPSTPNDYALEQNYPNPFNPATSIRFSIPQRGHVSLQVFDALGRLVEKLADGEFNPGNYQVVWEAASVPSGAYTYRLQAGDRTETRQMVVLK